MRQKVLRWCTDSLRSKKLRKKRRGSKGIKKWQKVSVYATSLAAGNHWVRAVHFKQRWCEQILIDAHCDIKGTHKALSAKDKQV